MTDTSKHSAVTHSANDDIVSAGYQVHFGNAEDEALAGRWWWTLFRAGWSGIEVSDHDFATERDAWSDAARANALDSDCRRERPDVPST